LVKIGESLKALIYVNQVGRDIKAGNYGKEYFTQVKEEHKVCSKVGLLTRKQGNLRFNE